MESLAFWGSTKAAGHAAMGFLHCVFENVGFSAFFRHHRMFNSDYALVDFDELWSYVVGVSLKSCEAEERYYIARGKAVICYYAL